MLNEKNKPFPRRYYLTFLWTIYVDLFFWFIIGVLFYRWWGTRREWVSGCIAVELKKDSWPKRSWFQRWGGASLMHCLLLNEGGLGKPHIVDKRIERHELIHTKQAETMQLLAAIFFGYLVLSSGFQWQYLLILPSGALVAYIASLFQAFLRGESPYRGSIFEDHAYLADDE